MKTNLICVICPKGCPLTVEHEGNTVLSVTGNTCPRGEVYAKNELLNPVRTLTTTMICDNGAFVSVKTDKPVKKGNMMEYMKKINETTVKVPVEIGDVLLYNIDSEGANVIATKSVK